MTTSEKRLLRLALIMFLGYMLPFQILPRTYNFYHNYQESIEKLQRDIELYENLKKKAEFWGNENQLAKKERERIEAGLVPGANRDLVGNKLQGLVRQLAQEASIGFKSLVTPEYFPTGEWILIIQSMQFEANSETLMAFLKAVDKAQYHLTVASLDVRSRRDQLTGTIKIAGFSRVPIPLDSEE